MGQPGGSAHRKRRERRGKGLSMKPEEYTERKMDIEGWPVNITTYRLGDEWYCKVDNVSPGAWLARTKGASREAVEKDAIGRARGHLSKTLRRDV